MGALDSVSVFLLISSRRNASAPTVETLDVYDFLIIGRVLLATLAAGLKIEKICGSERRYKSGMDSVIGKKYMVYFVQSPFSRNFQSSWICGGALVSTTQILTAAACLIEAENIYAIAGYKRYLQADSIEDDDCTKSKKQRIIKILVPTGYKLDYENPAQGMNIDIGVAIVENPYNFTDLTYLVHCSYEPQPIKINFEYSHESVNTPAVALGWGVRQKTTDFFQVTKYQLLQEMSTILVDTNLCTNINETKEVVEIIQKYHLCGTFSWQEGKEDDEINKKALLNNFGFRRSFNDEDSEMARGYTDIIKFDGVPNITINRTDKTNSDARRAFSPKICQNNLGSPLIKWIRNREVVIGITSSTNMNGDCNGPFLYVSTAASYKIIKCLLETNPFTRKLCSRKIKDEPYEIQEIDIKWPDYEQSKMLEPMLLVQRAVLDKIQPLIPRATVNYFHSRSNINLTNKYNRQRSPTRYKLPQSYEYDQNHDSYVHQRAELPPLLPRPHHNIALKQENEKQQNPVPHNLPTTSYFMDIPKKQLPPLLSRPQHFVRHQKEQQGVATSRNFIPTQHKLLKQEFKLNQDQQFHELQVTRKLNPDPREEYKKPELQKYPDPLYHTLPRQPLIRHEQNNGHLGEQHYYDPMKKTQPLQLYGLPSEDFIPLGDHQYEPQQQELYQQQQNLQYQQQYQQPRQQYQQQNRQYQQQRQQYQQQNRQYPQHQQNGQQHQQKRYRQYQQQRYQQQPLPQQSELEANHHAFAQPQQSFIRPGHQLSPSQLHNSDLQLELNKQPESQSSWPIHLTSTLDYSIQHNSLENKSVSEQTRQPEVLYDLSHEQQFGEPDVYLSQPPESKQPQSAFQKRSPEPSNFEEQNHYPIRNIASSTSRPVEHTTSLADDDVSFSFDELFAQVKGVPNESHHQLTPGSFEDIFKNKHLRITNSSPQERNIENRQEINRDEDHGIYESHFDMHMQSDEVMIRPQIPMITG